MKKALSILLLLPLLVFWQPSAHANKAEFERGLQEVYAGNYEEAYKIFLPLGEQGHAGAQYYLGSMYQYGEGVPQDYKEAVKWYRLAAKQEVNDAIIAIGRMYFTGQGVPQDYMHAYMWLSLATVAQYNREVGEDLEFARSQLTPSQLEKAEALAERCFLSDYEDCEDCN